MYLFSDTECVKKGQNLRLRGEDSIKDTFPPFLVADMKDILYDVGQAGLRDRTVQTNLQERGPFPLEGPLTTHVTLQNRERDVFIRSGLNMPK